MKAPRLLPMLAGGSGIPTDAANYQFEPKLDGQRVVATLEGGQVVLTNRRGLDITATFPELTAMAAGAPGHDVVLDGEVVTFDADGHTSFQRLQRRMNVARPTPKLLAEVPVVFVAFDLLWYDGEWLIACPQHERTRILGALAFKGSLWQTAPVLDATPDEIVEACRQAGLEGFMAKRRDASYLPGKRSSAWWKVKCGARRRELVVAGWSTGHGGREGSIGSLALGVYDVTPDEAERLGRPQRLLYVGQAGSGLSEETIRLLTNLFAQTAVDTSPFANPTPAKLNYVRPMLVVEVAYTEVTEGGTLRQPSIKGLRTDVVADEIVADDEILGRLPSG